MQSTMDSWQFEKFSTAELSPPISPAPPSPTLYHHVDSAPLSPYGTSTCYDNDISKIQAQKVMLQEQDPKLQQAVFRQSRAQVATSILKDLERLGDMNFRKEPEFGDNWLEESVDLNMELFEELSEIAYTPDQMNDGETAQSSLSPVSTPSHLSEQSILHMQGLQEPQFEPEKFDQLKAEFQAILESLPTDPSSIGDVIDILGIRTTLVGDEEMISLELAEETIANDLGVEMEMEVSSTEDDSVVLIDEKDVLFQISQKGLNISDHYECYEPYIASSPEHSIISEDEDDIEANTAEKILDALLQGNLQEANSYIPVEVPQVASRIVPLSIEHDSDSSNCSIISEVQKVVPTMNKRNSTKAAEANAAKKSKTERRGRKPGSTKKSMAFLTDKAMRKKEQNKTAATRYRQKKKMETHCTVKCENELQAVHDDLATQKEDLQRQILMVKQLLREVVKAKKNQAPKRTNRRKL